MPNFFEPCRWCSLQIFALQTYESVFFFILCLIETEKVACSHSKRREKLSRLTVRACGTCLGYRLSKALPQYRGRGGFSFFGGLFAFGSDGSLGLRAAELCAQISETAREFLFPPKIVKKER